MRCLSLLAAACLAAFSLPATAGVRADVSVYDRHDGRELPVHVRDGRRYVAGEPGHEYEIRVRNRSGARVLAVTSVDGVNVLSGDTASTDQAGYVLDSYGETRIAGWRKNLSEVASFYFTRLPDSYAARTGRPDDVGVIGVALFREKSVPCCRWWHDEDDRLGRMETPAAESESRAGASADAAAPAAKSAPRKSEKLGTGHGERLDSAATQVEFERASDQPDEVITIYYDSRSNLVAQGVIPKKRWFAQRRPDPFPQAGFVPDP